MAGLLSLRRYALGVVIVLGFLLVPTIARSITGEHADPASEFAFFTAFVVIVPFTLTVGLRWGTRRALSTWWTIAAAYGLAAASGAAIALAWQLGGLFGLVDEFNRDAAYVASIAKGAYLGVAMVGFWGMFVLLPRAVHDARERERERQELRRDAERARVRAALEPHFVLNTLNAISGLVGEDPDMARDLIGDLGDLLRDVVRLSEQELQPAAAEIAWLQRYARILEARHHGRLVVEWSIDPAAAAMPVPVLVLQPLLENAIQHGALQRPGGGRVRVELAITEHALCCTIEDDGPGMLPEIRDHARGLDLTRRRLACDAPGSTLTIDSAPSGTRATIHLAAA